MKKILRFQIFVVALMLAGGIHAQRFVEQDVRLEVVTDGTQDTQIIAGTLTMPTEVKGKVPAVILITGSGAQNRDEEIMGHKPFKVIAEYLSSNGYAVLRYDDRGVGGSTGDMVHATAMDFASDVDHLLIYLQSPLSNLKIDPKRIILFGHSEGATVAAIAAVRNRHTLNPVAGVIMLGGAGVDGKKILLQQNETIFLQRGVPDSLVARRLDCMGELFNVCDTITLKQGMDTVKSLNLAFRPIFKKHSEGLTKEQKQQTGLTNSDCFGWATTVATPWMRTFLSLDPTDYIAMMRCPLLAIGGEKDCQVPAESNLSAIESFCKQNNIPHTIIKMPDINHLGQVSKSGSVDEYSSLGQAPDDRVLKAILSWLNSL